WVSPIGHSMEQVWPRLLAGESGISRTSIFDASTFPTSISAEVKDFRLADHLSDIAAHAGAGRNTQFALAACQQAWRSAGLPAFNSASNTQHSALDLDRVGIYLGFGEGSLDFEAYTASAL